MNYVPGDALEHEGQQVFTQMNLVCAHQLADVQLRLLDPVGPWTSDESLEFDYLIPVGHVALVGEITDRSRSDKLSDKYTRFRRHFRWLTEQQPNDALWRLLGVKDTMLGDFANVTSFLGFVIAARLQDFDAIGTSLEHPVSQAPIFFARDWAQIKEYARTLGPFGRSHFLGLLKLQLTDTPMEIRVESFLHTVRKKVAGGDVGLADVFTFEHDPYDLLPAARVYRRDDLPDLSADAGAKFQRPLQVDKLQRIRENLLIDADFMFPHSILAVLSSQCTHDAQNGVLRIPQEYGALSIIDGQHRLFSYADEQVEQRMHSRARILITAIKFREATESQTRTYSARAFIEINTNQTRIPQSHLDAIAYDVLGDTGPRALAAKVVLELNRYSGRLRGLFKTSQTSLGRIRTATIVTHLRLLTDVSVIDRVATAEPGTPDHRVRVGYEQQFKVDDINALRVPSELILQARLALGNFFNEVADVFPSDWPERQRTKGSSLEYAKIIAALIRLFWAFMQEGLSRPAVRLELERIRTNVLDLRGLSAPYDGVLFAAGDARIPRGRPTVEEDLEFLMRNRVKPTSLEEIREEQV